MSNLLTRCRVVYAVETVGGHIVAKGDLTRGERLQIMLSPEELEAVDDFRFKQRMPSRAAAVRELFRLGMAAVGIMAEPGMKSGSFGVFDTNPGGHHRNGDKPKPKKGG